MNTRTILVLGLGVLIGVAVASLLIARREAPQPAAPQAAKVTSDHAGNQARPAVTTAVEPVAPEPANPPTAPRVKPKLPPLGQPPQAPNFPDPRLNDPVFKEHLGRYALDYVGGGDADADEGWMQIINDPSLSADARQNLIEDLNENGLSDPQNPTVEDLPLILNRLALIEELAPDAMDQVNWDAFMEAYKDLADMAVRLGRRIGR